MTARTPTLQLSGAYGSEAEYEVARVRASARAAARLVTGLAMFVPPPWVTIWTLGPLLDRPGGGMGMGIFVWIFSLAWLPLV
jgi:hypothetical protein